MPWMTKWNKFLAVIPLINIDINIFLIIYSHYVPQLIIYLAMKAFIS